MKLISKTLILLIANTGLRSQECANLELRDIDLINRVLSVRLGKGNKNRRIGLNQEALSVIKEFLDARPKTGEPNFFVFKNGKPISRDALAQRFSRRKEKGWIDASLHSLRRSFASRNADVGRPLTVIQAALGHSSLLTTQNYIIGC